MDSATSISEEVFQYYNFSTCVTRYRSPVQASLCFSLSAQVEIDSFLHATFLH